jgi:hypothetical protein
VEDVVVVRPLGSVVPGRPLRVPLGEEAPEPGEVQTRGQVRRARWALAAGLLAGLGSVGGVMGAHASTERRLDGYAQEYQEAATAAATASRDLWRARFAAQVVLQEAPEATTTDVARELAAEVEASAGLMDRIDGTRRVLRFATFAEAEAAIGAVEDLAARAAAAARSIGAGTEEVDGPAG